MSLVEGIVKHDSPVLEFIYDSYAGCLYGRIIAIVEDHDCVIRILERTFLYAVKHIEEHNPRLRLHTWLLEIAQFKILDELSSSLTGIALSPELHLDDFTFTSCSLSID